MQLSDKIAVVSGGCTRQCGGALFSVSMQVEVLSQESRDTVGHLSQRVGWYHLRAVWHIVVFGMVLCTSLALQNK